MTDSGSMVGVKPSGKFIKTCRVWENVGEIHFWIPASAQWRSPASQLWMFYLRFWTVGTLKCLTEHNTLSDWFLVSPQLDWFSDLFYLLEAKWTTIVSLLTAGNIDISDKATSFWNKQGFFFFSLFFFGILWILSEFCATATMAASINL